MTLKFTNKDFWEHLDEAMDGRTNVWLSEKTGISESEISRIRRGILRPSDNQIERICAALPSLQDQ